MFAAVVDHGSLSRAATALHLSQPSLSRQLASLEREAGSRLLERGPAGAAPTAAGNALLARALAIRAHTEAAARELDDHQRRTLRIASFPTAIQTLVVEAMVELGGRDPAVEVKVEEADRTKALEQVLAGHADIAITFADFESELAGLQTTTLLREPMLLATSTRDQPETDSAVRLSDLRERDWILGTESGGLGLIRRACRAAGFEPRAAARLDHQGAIQAAVAAGVGVTLLPALATRELRAGVTLRELRSPHVRRFVLAHTMSGPSSAAARAGLEALRQAANGQS